MQQDPHAPPSIKEELDRKTTDMLVELAHHMEQDNVEPAMANVEAHAIWKLTAGLVSDDISTLAEQLATQAAQAAQHSASARERVYLRHESTGEVARFTYALAAPGLTLEFIGPAQRAPVVSSVKPGTERRAQLRTLIKALVAKGYRLI